MNWEIDKKINIGNAITALMIAMSVFWWAAQVEKRIAILEVKTDALVKILIEMKNTQLSRDGHQDAEINELEKAMRDKYQKVHQT